jgi:hypothetical protein
MKVFFDALLADARKGFCRRKADFYLHLTGWILANHYVNMTCMGYETAYVLSYVHVLLAVLRRRLSNLRDCW